MNRSEDDKKNHDRLVSAAFEHCAKNGYSNIKVDLPDKNPPDNLGGHVPDLTAKDKNGDWLILEAETYDSLGLDHTRDQLSAFAGYNAEMVLLVPKKCETEATNILVQWKLSQKVKVWMVT